MQGRVEHIQPARRPLAPKIAAKNVKEYFDSLVAIKEANVNG
jgi:hypothetical protein